MSWAKVKKINSDMTKPLDKLFKDSIRIAANESFILEELVGSGGIMYDRDDGALFTRLVNVSGEIYITVSLKRRYSEQSANILVQVNGTTKASFTPTSTSYESFHKVLSINAGDTLSFAVERDAYGSRGQMKLLKLCGLPMFAYPISPISSL